MTKTPTTSIKHLFKNELALHRKLDEMMWQKGYPKSEKQLLKKLCQLYEEAREYGSKNPDNLPLSKEQGHTMPTVDLIITLKNLKRPVREGETYWAEHPDILWNEAIDRAIKAVNDV